MGSSSDAVHVVREFLPGGFRGRIRMRYVVFEFRDFNRCVFASILLDGRDYPSLACVQTERGCDVRERAAESSVALVRPIADFVPQTVCRIREGSSIFDDAEFFEALVKFAYHLCVVIDGAAFIRSSVSCVTGLEVLAAPDYVSDSTKDMAFSIFGIACYTAFIWGTYALVDVLQKGGTGDEKVAEDDVLALVKTSPTKLLVLSSAFGFASLRPGVLILCCVTLGMSFFHAFNNIYRMTNWCGQMAFENHWCIWPFGSVTAADQLLCGVISLVSIQALVSMRSNTELKLVKYFWFMFSLTSFGGMLWSFYIILDKYPSFWMNGMRTDFWLYYGRFWIAILIGIFMHSISVIRVAGGVGWESEADAKEIIYSKLNEDLIADKKRNSLSDLLGMDIPIQEDAKMEGIESVMRSRESSSAGTPG